MTRAEWKNFIAEHERSGLSASAWCKKHGLRPNQYHYWKKRLEEDEAGSEESKFVRIGTNESMELLVGDKLRVKVRRDFDSALLKRLLEALGC